MRILLSCLLLVLSGCTYFRPQVFRPQVVNEQFEIVNYDCYHIYLLAASDPSTDGLEVFTTYVIGCKR